MKGALISVDQASSSTDIVPFQYNPASVRRTLQPQMSGGEPGDRSESVRFTGAPIETISVDVEIDATDQLEKGDSTAESVAIYPLIYELQLIAYPKSSQVTRSASLLDQGTMEVIPMTAPTTYFIWGARRVLPVRVNTVTVSEEAFDAHLNPIRARVSLSMRVLSYSDLSSSASGYHSYLSHQMAMEALAKVGSDTGGDRALGINVSRLR